MNLFRFAIAVSQHQIDSRGGRRRFLQFGGDHAANAMLLEGALKFSGALMVFNGQPAIHHFDDGDVTAKGVQDRGEFTAHCTGTENNHFAGNRREL